MDVSPIMICRPLWKFLVREPPCRRKYAAQYAWLRERTAKSQADTFEKLVVLLIGRYLHLVVITFQNLLCDGQDGHNKFASCFHTVTVNVILSLNVYHMLLVVE